jgi:effector-binding domain-containing protein
MMIRTYEITSRELVARHTAVVRGEMPAGELAAWLAGVYLTVQEYLTGSGAEPTGPPFARYTFLRDQVAVEAGFPVAGEISGDDLVAPSMLPAGPAAVTTHVGPYEELEVAYRAVRDWLAGRGLTPAGPHWEVYLTDPNTEPDPAHWRTDLVVPYRDAVPR